MEQGGARNDSGNLQGVTGSVTSEPKSQGSQYFDLEDEVPFASNEVPAAIHTTGAEALGKKAGYVGGAAGTDNAEGIEAKGILAEDEAAIAGREVIRVTAEKGLVRPSLAQMNQAEKEEKIAPLDAKMVVVNNGGREAQIGKDSVVSTEGKGSTGGAGEKLEAKGVPIGEALVGDKKEVKKEEKAGPSDAAPPKPKVDPPKPRADSELKDPFANLPGRAQISDKVLVGPGTGSSEQQAAGAKVQGAVAAFAGKKGSKVTNSTILTPEHWRTIFKTTGMYQGYAIDEDVPMQSLKSLFTNSADEPASSSTRSAPTKPSFLQMDKMSISVDHANTQRRRYFVESGFRSADLSISIPYVAASVKADATEKMAKEQEIRTVYFTTKAEFPRCRIDVRSSIESRYLRISRDFLDDIREIWKTLKDLEKELPGVKLDGKADLIPSQEHRRRSKLAGSDLGGSDDADFEDELRDKQSRVELDHARDKQRIEVHALQRSIIAPMRDLIKRYGAVWVEQVTLGGQIYKTSKEEVHWDSAVSEKTESIKADVKAAAGPGAAGIGAAFGSARTEGNQSLNGTNQVSHQAVGGDTLLYEPDHLTEWLDSVKDPELWRIISLTKLKKLDELPGLENYGLVDMAGDRFEKVHEWSSEVGWGEASQGQVLDMRHILQYLLEIVAAVTTFEEHVRKVPRRQLGSAWVNTLKGHWYGCYTWHKSLSFPPRPCIMTMTIDKPEVSIFSAKTLGVESTYLHQLKLKGEGTDDKGSFTMNGVLQEVESKLRRVKDSAYEVLALVELRKTYEAGTEGSRWTGSHSLKYATKRSSEVERKTKTGCLARFSGHNNLRGDHTESIVYSTPTISVPSLDKGSAKEQHDLKARESIRMREGTWVYKGHLDRMGMHGYWAYESHGEVGSSEQRIEQEGGTWTLAPIEELPKAEEYHELPVFTSEELKASRDGPVPLQPIWKPLFVSPSDNAADLMTLLQPTGCPIHIDGLGLTTPTGALARLASGPVPPRLRERCSDCAAAHDLIARKQEFGLVLRKANSHFRKVLVADRQLAPGGHSSLDLVGMEGLYLEVVSVEDLTRKLNKLNKLFAANPRVNRKPRSLPTYEPGTPWSFVQPENEVNEPRRRWLLPPEEALPSSKRVERPLSADRFKGDWHGYMLNAPLLQKAENDRADSGVGGNVDSIVLPPPTRVQVTMCRTLGGTVGNLKYLVEARGRRMSGSRLLTWKLRGTLTQLPLAEPLNGPAEHTYPILGEVDLTGRAHFLGVRVPFLRQRFYKGHLDYLGMHGFHGEIGKANLKGTFGFMPVRDVEDRQEVKTDAAALIVEKNPAGRRQRGLKCWPSRKTATDGDLLS